MQLAALGETQGCKSLVPASASGAMGMGGDMKTLMVSLLPDNREPPSYQLWVGCSYGHLYPYVTTTRVSAWLPSRALRVGINHVPSLLSLESLGGPELVGRSWKAPGCTGHFLVWPVAALLVAYPTGPHLHLVDVGGVNPLATAWHHRLAAAVRHETALGLWRQDVGTELPVGRAVTPAALELEGGAEWG